MQQPLREPPLPQRAQKGTGLARQWLERGKSFQKQQPQDQHVISHLPLLHHPPPLLDDLRELLKLSMNSRKPSAGKGERARYGLRQAGSKPTAGDPRAALLCCPCKGRRAAPTLLWGHRAKAALRDGT